MKFYIQVAVTYPLKNFFLFWRRQKGVEGYTIAAFLEPSGSVIQFDLNNFPTTSNKISTGVLDFYLNSVPTLSNLIYAK